jgi:hypothetical protein
VAAVDQPTLIDVEPSEAAGAAPAARQTSKGIGAGDIVLIDKKGRRFHAEVTELEQLDSGRFELVVRPLDSRISWRTASVREVVEVWRRVRRA